MEIGKIPGDKLKEIILNKIEYRRDDVLVHAGIGEDSAVVDLKGELLVISSDPITGASEHAGYLAVHVACNDLAATGALPVGIQLVLLLPENIREEDIAELMDEINHTAADNNIEILGGHTEILSAVKKPIIIVTAVGKVAHERYVSSAGATVGDDLVLTKGVGIEGTYILANDFSEILREKGISEYTINSAQNYGKKLSVIKEGLIAARMNAHAMHDVTEGGLYGALDELTQAAGNGFDLYLENLPVSTETDKICQALEIDPAGLISSGSMLIAIAETDTHDLIEKLNSEGIKAAKIGKVTENTKNVIKRGKKIPFKWSNKDELWRLME